MHVFVMKGLNPCVILWSNLCFYTCLDRSMALFPHHWQAEHGIRIASVSTRWPASRIDGAMMVGAFRALANTLYCLGDSRPREKTRYGVSKLALGDAQSPAEEVHAPVVACLCYKAASEWHLGELADSRSRSQKRFHWRMS